MPSRPGPPAAAIADSLQALHDARAQVWRIECSALLLGRRFVDTCQALGIDAQRLPIERRQAIDEAMARVDAPDAVDELLAELRRLLLQPLN